MSEPGHPICGYSLVGRATVFQTEDAGSRPAIRSMKWTLLKERLPSGGDSVLLFDPSLYLDRSFPGHSVSVSNPDFARSNALKQGYTHWCIIPYPMPIDVSAIKSWYLGWRGYQLEDDLLPPPTPRRTWKQELLRRIYILLS